MSSTYEGFKNSVKCGVTFRLKPFSFSPDHSPRVVGSYGFGGDKSEINRFLWVNHMREVPHALGVRVHVFPVLVLVPPLGRVAAANSYSGHVPSRPRNCHPHDELLDYVKNS